MSDLSQRWPLPDQHDLRDQLLKAWDDPGRGYHDLVHLREVLDRLDELREAGVPFARVPVELAVWFHDAVYDTSPEPEARSAQWASEALSHDPALAEEVARLVLLTEHHDADPADHDGSAMCDADLGVLAADPARYAEYVAGVRTEYAEFDDETFRAGRHLVLLALAEGALFRTSHAIESWDHAARRNIAAELEGLVG